MIRLQEMAKQLGQARADAAQKSAEVNSLQNVVAAQQEQSAQDKRWIEAQEAELDALRKQLASTTTSQGIPVATTQTLMTAVTSTRSHKGCRSGWGSLFDSR